MIHIDWILNPKIRDTRMTITWLGNLAFRAIRNLRGKYFTFSSTILWSITSFIIYFKEEKQNELTWPNSTGRQISFVLINHRGKVERQSVSDLVKLGFNPACAISQMSHMDELLNFLWASVCLFLIHWE